MAEDVRVDWDNYEFAKFVSPEGPIGSKLRDCGDAVTRRAKLLALKRTGRMAAEIRSTAVHEDQFSLDPGLVVEIESPAVVSRTGFPYPVVFEGRNDDVSTRGRPLRIRRTHRSLIPALNEVGRFFS